MCPGSSCGVPHKENGSTCQEAAEGWEEEGGWGEGEGRGGGDFKTPSTGFRHPSSEERCRKARHGVGSVGASLPVKSVFSVGQYEQAGNEVGRTDFVGKPD